MCQESREEHEAATIELSNMVERVRNQTDEAEVTIEVLADQLAEVRLAFEAGMAEITARLRFHEVEAKMLKERQQLLLDAVQRLDNTGGNVGELVGLVTAMNRRLAQVEAIVQAPTLLDRVG